MKNGCKTGWFFWSFWYNLRDCSSICNKTLFKMEVVWLLWVLLELRILNCNLLTLSHSNMATFWFTTTTHFKYYCFSYSIGFICTIGEILYLTSIIFFSDLIPPSLALQSNHMNPIYGCLILFEMNTSKSWHCVAAPERP